MEPLTVLVGAIPIKLSSYASYRWITAFLSESILDGGPEPPQTSLFSQAHFIQLVLRRVIIMLLLFNCFGGRVSQRYSTQKRKLA
jgi:hypothetical protein